MAFGKWIFVCVGVMTTSVHALVERGIDEKNPLEVVLSKTSHNRICVEGGAVEKVIGSSSLFAIALDPTTGNAFVNLLQDLGDKPSTLTVVTSSGLIQDLTVLSKEGPSEQVVLREFEEAEEEVQMLDFSHASTVELLNQIFEGNVPFGYGERTLAESDNLECPKPLQAQAIRAFDGPYETIVVYEVQNVGKQCIDVASDDLKNENKSWVFLNAHELRSKERALCVVGKIKDVNQ